MSDRPPRTAQEWIERVKAEDPDLADRLKRELLAGAAEVRRRRILAGWTDPSTAVTREPGEEEA